MIDLNQLKAGREAAATDKADLFDFYHEHWGELVYSATNTAETA